MSFDWQVYTLEELADDITVGYVGSMTTEYVEHGIPFLRSKNIDKYSVNFDDIRYISREFHDRIKKSALSPGDVVIVRTGKPGTAAIIPNSLSEANCSDLVIIRPGLKLDRYFLVYYLNSFASQHIDAYLVGAVQQHFNIGEARKLQIRIPPIKQQGKIAQILRTLDDKIELNRRMNQTLEAMAQAIFQSWFVDFDPVKAKLAALATGRDPERAAMAALAGKLAVPKEIDELAEEDLAAAEAALDQLTEAQRHQLAQTAALFPAALVESELGLIPMGWEVQSLDEIATYTNGLALQNFPVMENEEGLPVIKIAEMRSGFSEKSGRATRDIKDDYVIQNGDILFSWSGSLLVKQWHLGEGALNQHLFRVTSDQFPKWYYYFATLHHLPWLQSIAASKATTMGHIQRKHLSQAQMAVHQDVINGVNYLIAPLLDKALQVLVENNTLANIRNTLLPKLLSGEVMVPETEEILD